MNEYIVENREAVAAAILAAAQPSHELAKKHPARIELTGTRAVWNFPFGIHEHRAQVLAGLIRRTPASAFKS